MGGAVIFGRMAGEGACVWWEGVWEETEVGESKDLCNIARVSIRGRAGSWCLGSTLLLMYSLVVLRYGLVRPIITGFDFSYAVFI